MVSGIMGALDMAPTLHFVELGLEINSEEDEHFVPNCAANAPSHACRLACDHHKTVLHGTVEFQPPCSPDLSPLDFSVERAQDTARSVSSSCKSGRFAGTLDARVSQHVDRQQLDVREKRQGMGAQADGVRCRQRRLFREAQPLQITSYRSETHRKTRHCRAFETPIAFSTDTERTAPQTQTTH